MHLYRKATFEHVAFRPNEFVVVSEIGYKVCDIHTHTHTHTPPPHQGLHAHIVLGLCGRHTCCSTVIMIYMLEIHCPDCVQVIATFEGLTQGPISCGSVGGDSSTLVFGGLEDCLITVWNLYKTPGAYLFGFRFGFWAEEPPCACGFVRKSLLFHAF